MKKSINKLIRVIAVISLSIMLAACSTVPTQNSLPEQQNVQTDEQEQLPVYVSPAEAIPEQINPPGIHLASIEWNTVVSITRDGNQVIPEDYHRYNELEEKAKRIVGNPEMNLYAFDSTYKTNSQEPLYKTTFSNLSQYRTPDGVIDWIALSGDWDPFPCVVSYRKYSLEEQQKTKEWASHFKNLLVESIPDTPVIITEAWFFDLDGDGKKEAFVNAGNTLKTEKDAKASQPQGDKTGVYSFSALFSESLGIIDLDKRLWLVEHDFTNENITASYTEPVDKKYYENYVTAIQFGENGEYIKSPIYNLGEYDYPPRSFPIVVDIDGDSRAELLSFRQQIYGPIQVYQVKENKLNLNYTIAIGA